MLQREPVSSADVGAGLALATLMSHDPNDPNDPNDTNDANDTNDTNEPRIIYEQGAIEERNEKIDAIVGDEVLGYDGSARGEHSGQASEQTEDSLTDSLANNRPEDMK